MTKKRRVYQPRFFDGRIITSDEIYWIHKEVLKFERIEVISDPMRELIEDLWPGLALSLPKTSGYTRKSLNSSVSKSFPIRCAN